MIGTRSSNFSVIHKCILSFRSAFELTALYFTDMVYRKCVYSNSWSTLCIVHTVFSLHSLSHVLHIFIYPILSQICTLHKHVPLELISICYPFVYPSIYLSPLYTTCLTHTSNSIPLSPRKVFVCLIAFPAMLPGQSVHVCSWCLD